MKCTHCNSTKLIKTDLSNIFRIGGDGTITVSKTLEVYMCEECGHIEMFDSSLITKNKRTKEVNEHFDSMFLEQNEKKELLVNGEKNKSLHDELYRITIKLQSLDITIREQQELKLRVIDIKRELSLIENEISNIQKEVCRLKREREQKLNKINSDYENRFRWY